MLQVRDCTPMVDRSDTGVAIVGTGMLQVRDCTPMVDNKAHIPGALATAHVAGKGLHSHG